MKRMMTLLLAVGVAAGFATTGYAAGRAAEHNKARAFCSGNADLGFQACAADIAEEFYRGEAVCLNVIATAERTRCRRELRAEREELRSECAAIHESRLGVCELLGEGQYDPDFSPEGFVHPDEIGVQNPFLDLTPGQTSVLRSGDSEIVVIHVTDRIKTVAGVPCRVVVDAALEIEHDAAKNGGGVEYVVVEITDDWYASQAMTGDVWYCGEHVMNYEDGVLVNLDGSFEIGVQRAKGGILVPFAPQVGQAYRQEFAMDEAEDLAIVRSLAASPADKGAGAFDCNGGCLETFEYAPLEPDHAELKYYVPGVGFILALPIEDGELTGESEYLACAGDSLDVLADPACRVEDLDALLDALCKLDPETFCDE